MTTQVSAPEFIRSRRRALGLSQRALGDLAGVSRSMVARAERGDPSLAWSVVVKLTQAIGQAQRRAAASKQADTAPNAGAVEVTEPTAPAKPPLLTVPAVTVPTLADCVVAREPGGWRWGVVAITRKGAEAVRAIAGAMAPIFTSSPVPALRAAGLGVEVAVLGEADTAKTLVWSDRAGFRAIRDPEIHCMIF